MSPILSLPYNTPFLQSHHRVSPLLKPKQRMLKVSKLLDSKRPPSNGSTNNNATKSQKPFTSIFQLEHLTSTLRKIMAPPPPPWVDPSKVFAGNYAPVEELAPRSCPVEGKIPESLNGVYVRNGPNPQFLNNNCPVHIFEGDGMLHSLRLSKGQATYCSRYVQTYKYKLEREAGFPIFPNVVAGFHSVKDMVCFLIFMGRIVTGRVNLMRGFGTANTSIAFLAKRVLALAESDLPYIISLTKEGDIETIGRWEFDKKSFANMTAHPKVDMDTNEAFAFRCSPLFPFITYFFFNVDGVKQQDVPLFSIKEPCFIHDFAITKHFAVFLDANLAGELLKLIVGQGTPEGGKVPRIGIIPRYCTNDSNMKWFQVPGFNAMHIINAWEQGEDEIVLVAPSILNIDDVFHLMGRAKVSLEKLVINTTTGQFSRTIMSETSLEFGSINANYVGKKNRYVYLGMVDVGTKIKGLVKIDLDKGCEVSRRLYGAHCFGGETLFVPRKEDDLECEEDDGFVVTYVHNEESGESSFLVMDAKSPDLSLLATVKLPRRVPYGFHGLFVREKYL